MYIYAKESYAFVAESIFFAVVFGVSGPVSWAEVVLVYIRYPHGKDTIEFVSNMFFRWPDDTPVMVRYSRIDPVDARIDLPVCVWGDTMVHILLPMGIWLVLLLTPNRFDPLIPWGCRVLLRWGWPPITIVAAPEAGRARKPKARLRSGGKGPMGRGVDGPAGGSDGDDLDK
jgi:hypothetical protein